ncbi:hypothetical protein VTP01DRAFT_8616 [Rhizomucor pusillus]|uniref:uncharacterized protein n=1 Tax=Rhizomucor pusillus TaxID=4840 RepID=UPI0037426067
MSTTVAAAYKITTGTADDDDDWSPKVKPRWRFSKAATRILEEFFGENPNPVQATIDDLAKKLHSPRRTVNTWFQNRRAKQRRIQKRSHQVQQQQQQYQQATPQACSLDLVLTQPLQVVAIQFVDNLLYLCCQYQRHNRRIIIGIVTPATIFSYAMASFQIPIALCKLFVAARFQEHCLKILLLLPMPWRLQNRK